MAAHIKRMGPQGEEFTRYSLGLHLIRSHSHPQSGWLDTPPEMGSDQGHISAVGALFRKPSPKVMVSHKTIKQIPYSTKSVQERK
jgi:hypothetical protein